MSVEYKPAVKGRLKAKAENLKLSTIKLVLYIFLAVLVFGSKSFAADNSYTLTDVDAKNSVQCASSDFSKFIAIFSESIELQKKYIVFPLEMLMVVDTDPEPKAVEKKYKPSQIVFPVMPNSAERKKRQLRLKINKNKKLVTLEKPDTDYMVNYFFERKNACWYLVRIEDWSL